MPTTVWGKFDQAIDWLKKAETNPELSAVLTAQLFEAMSHFRAGRQDEGRKLFAAAIARIDHELPKAGVRRITNYETGSCAKSPAGRRRS